MKTPEFNKWLKIKSGTYDGWFLKVEDDTQGITGGYYIYYVKDMTENSGEGFDNWVETETNLEKYFESVDFDLQNNDEI